MMLFRKNPLYLQLILLGLVLLLSSSCTLVKSQSGRIIDPEQTENAEYIKAVVKSVSLETQKFILKPNKGDKLTIWFDENTAYSGMTSFEDIQRKRRLKVWYLKKRGKNIAIKMELIAEVGC